MTWFESNLLSLLLFLPLFGAILLSVFPAEEKGAIRNTALVLSGLVFLLSLRLVSGFDAANGDFQFLVNLPWITAIGVSYHVGLDGISLWLIILTTFLTPLVILSAYGAITERVKEYMISILVLETGMLGAFVALDLVLFYIFWELMLIPMYLLIGIYGGPRRIYAAVKFFIFTMAGSVLMLVAILYLYFQTTDAETGQHTFDLLRMYGLNLPLQAQLWCFAAFALSFAIKVPMFPLHTWLPDAHVEAPTGGSVILAAVLLKMGTYGFLRFALPLFPAAAKIAAYPIAVLALIGIIYGAWVAMVQPDVKKLIAYSSVSHLGFVMLGIAALNITSISGSIYQMLSHGISTGALFLLVGVLYERRHTREISDFGGLAKVMPFYAAVMLIICLSSIGLPPLNGFIGEFLILLGAFTSENLPWAKTLTIIAATGVIFAAVYLLWMYQRIFFGPVTKEENRGLKDLSLREAVVLLPFVLAAIGMGVFPQFFLSRMDSSVKKLMERLETRAAMAEPAEPRPPHKLGPLVRPPVRKTTHRLPAVPQPLRAEPARPRVPGDR